MRWLNFLSKIRCSWWRSNDWRRMGSRGGRVYVHRVVLWWHYRRLGVRFSLIALERELGLTNNIQKHTHVCMHTIISLIYKYRHILSVICGQMYWWNQISNCSLEVIAQLSPHCLHMFRSAISMYIAALSKLKWIIYYQKRSCWGCAQ